MRFIDFNRTVLYKKKKGFIGLLQIIYHNFLDLIMLNIVFTITSLPLITIWPSYTSLLAVCNKLSADIPTYPIKEYFFQFKKHFIKSSLYGIIFTITIAIISFSLFFYLNLGKENFVFYIFSYISILCLALIIMVSCWLFQIFLKESKTKSLIKNSFVLMILNFKESIIFLLCVILIMFVTLSLFPYSLPFITLFPAVTIALCSSYLYNKKD